jgi:glycogen operon protein
VQTRPSRDVPHRAFLSLSCRIEPSKGLWKRPLSSKASRIAALALHAALTMSSFAAAPPDAPLPTAASPCILPGESFPLGATWDGHGTNFAVFSEVAERVDLCLFDHDDRETRMALPDRTAFCWHGYVPGLGPGQKYGYRVHGPWDPAQGKRCNPAKLLIDPYAYSINGDVEWNDAVFPYPLGGDDLQRDDRDSAPYVPKGVVVDHGFEWGGDRRPGRKLHETIVYETHVKGFTQRCPAIPPELRGTYAGLAHPASIDYLVSLGITAVEVLPVHQFVHEKRLIDKGLRNYWGYNSIGFFAPHHAYAAAQDPAGAIREFKGMVKQLHAAGLEVLLDVVYNHTAEGNHLGPMLCFKGFDNEAYYRPSEQDRRYYVDYTGTGNSLNMRHPHVLWLIMDSLRYWVKEMHVDGFRFDLASTLAREMYDVDRLSAFFDVVHQDPTLQGVKLIAEPWDLGDGGYQVGNFPVRWCEWNGKYRDTVRDYWRGDDQTLGEFANRFTGSADLYQDDGRRPYASVNFMTAHDGFTLRDLVSYNDKHNEANGEDNQDGESHNRSWNCGAEGPTDDRVVNELRARQQRNFIATLLLSQGIPMLLGGDELGRTQNGNNNAYCQDNDVSWFDWDSMDHELLDFTRRLITLRRNHPVFRRRGWFKGRPLHGEGVSDIAWLRTDGRPMSEEDWGPGLAKSLSVFLNGDGLRELDQDGTRIRDASFLLLFNGSDEPLEFVLPDASLGESWEAVVDTAAIAGERRRLAAASAIAVEARSILVLSRP